MPLLDSLPRTHSWGVQLLSLPMVNIQNPGQVLSANFCQTSKPMMIKQSSSQRLGILHGTGKRSLHTVEQ